jgi:small subunit ribosomal protein S4
VDRRSFQVRPGMVIAIKEKSRKNKAIQEAGQNPNRSIPSYLILNETGFSGQLLNLPSLEEISLPLEVNLPVVCDFLAHKG